MKSHEISFTPIPRGSNVNCYIDERNKVMFQNIGNTNLAFNKKMFYQGSVNNFKQQRDMQSNNSYGVSNNTMFSSDNGNQFYNEIEMYRTHLKQSEVNNDRKGECYYSLNAKSNSRKFLDVLLNL